jgi:TPR repeat protein
MSDRLIPTPPVTPVLNLPTSTAQSNAGLTTTSTTESDASEPALSNKEAPKSPLAATADSNTVDSSVLEHSAPEIRDQSVSGSTTTGKSNSPSVSIDQLKEAASAGDANAQFELGKRFNHGVDVPKSDEEAIKWYSQSAEQGYVKAQHNLATMYAKGAGVEVDSSKAVEWYKKAANQGSALSKYKLSLLYQRGEGVEKNDFIAFSWCLEAADQGYAEAQYGLGMSYQVGRGVNSDPVLEHTWFSKAADQGHAKAQYELGSMYHYGRKEAGIDKDVSKAIDLYRKAANQGYAEAQCQLGWIYQHGIEFGSDTFKDYDKAVEWLRLAADQGNVGGQESLADMFKKGHGVKQSDENAVIWYAKAADQGAKYAQRELSLAYKEGKGITKDLNRSVYWQMKCNLNEDGDCIEGTFLDVSLSAGLIDFIVLNLKEEKDFAKVTKLSYIKNAFSDDEILGVCSLIRKNPSIKSLTLNGIYPFSKNRLELLVEALDANTHLTEFLYVKHDVDSKIKDKIAALLARNVAIAELRKYVEDNPLIRTASFPLDALKIIIDKTIVSYMVSGISKDETKNAIDELLLSASVYELEAEVKNQVKQ